MNSRIGLAVLMLLAMVASVAACDDCTNIWTTVLNTGGQTTFVQQAAVGGYDGSEHLGVMTGSIYQSIANDGTLLINQAMTSCDAWTLVEREDIVASGDTDLLKDVRFWTEDSTVQNGELKYPTEGWVEFGFATGTNDPLLFTWDNAYFKMTEPPAMVGGVGGHVGEYTKQIETSEDFMAFEKVGINQYPSTYVVPPRPKLPEFFCLWNQQQP